MAYNSEKWKKRIRSRTDLSSYVSHLIRETKEQSAYEVLAKILNEKRLIGSSNTGFIAGQHSAVCFQDVPIYSLCQNVLHEQSNRQELGEKIRYRAIGLAFSKRYIYSKGGRPVIYERLDIAKGFVNENEWWRIVSFDLSNDDLIVDWTHEREWRIKGNLEFELGQAYVLLTHKDAYKTFLKNVSDDTIRKIGGIIVLDPILT